MHLRSNLCELIRIKRFNVKYPQFSQEIGESLVAYVARLLDEKVSCIRPLNPHKIVLLFVFLDLAGRSIHDMHLHRFIAPLHFSFVAYKLVLYIEYGGG